MDTVEPLGNLGQDREFLGTLHPDPAWCRTCRFGHEGEPPFEGAPQKAWCPKFPKERGATKPADVMFAGAECDVYEQAEGMPYGPLEG